MFWRLHAVLFVASLGSMLDQEVLGGSGNLAAG